MRYIETEKITKEIKNHLLEINFKIEESLKNKLNHCLKDEVNPHAVEVLDILIRNSETAENNHLPLCQDTGLVVIFAEIGQEVVLTGGDFESAIQTGVSQAYAEGYLRKSLVMDPVLNRVNTGDNTPAIFHTRIVPGDQLSLTLMVKGGGSENQSALKMFTPSAGMEEIMAFVVERIIQAGGNPCPPLIVGLGIGGNFETCALLAKKALTLDLDESNPDPAYAEWEQKILQKINSTNVGPQGLGGKTTALAVHILTHPCHIASLPVAVNLECHAHRMCKIEL